MPFGVTLSKGFQLLADDRFEEAIEPLRAEAARDREDDYRIGAICEVGTAMLLAGRYVEAAEHFDALIEENGKRRISRHFILGGLTRWFQGRQAEAVACWRPPRNRPNHFGYRGLDIPFILYYAAVRSPDVFDRREAEQLIRKELPQAWSESDEARYARLLLGDLSQDDFTAATLRDKPLRNVKYWQREVVALIDYYLGLVALRDGDEARFMKLIRRAAGVTGYMNLYLEFVVAKCERRLLAGSA